MAVISGGGAGHEPLHAGFVGKGMLDGCCVGGVFQSPSPEQVFNVTKEVDDGAGVLYIYGNYNGDILNFDMGAEMADFEEDIRAMGQQLGSYQMIQKVEILPYHTLGVHKYEAMKQEYLLKGIKENTPEQIEQAANLFKKYFKTVQIN